MRKKPKKTGTYLPRALATALGDCSLNKVSAWHSAIDWVKLKALLLLLTFFFSAPSSF
jgi:hypothetical protein